MSDDFLMGVFVTCLIFAATAVITIAAWHLWHWWTS